MPLEDAVDSSIKNYVKYDELKQKVRQYLKMSSCDGRMERSILRKELAELIGEEYDDSKDALK